MGNYIYTREEFEQYSNDLFEFMIKEKIEPQKHEIYSLKDVARAHTVRMACLEAVMLTLPGSRKSENDRQTRDEAMRDLVLA